MGSIMRLVINGVGKRMGSWDALDGAIKLLIHLKFKVAVSESVTKGRYRAARAAKKTLNFEECCNGCPLHFTTLLLQFHQTSNFGKSYAGFAAIDDDLGVLKLRCMLHLRRVGHFANGRNIYNSH